MQPPVAPNPQKTALMAAVIPIGSVIFVASLLQLGPALEGRVLGWAALFLTTVLVGLFPVRIPGTRSVISITDSFIFASVLFFGIAPTVVLAGVDALISTRRMTRKVSSTLYSFAVMSSSVGASAWVFELLAQRPGVDVVLPLEALIFPVVSMALCHYLIDSGLVATITALSHRQSVLKTWVDNFLWSSVSFFSGASAAAVIYVFVRSNGMVAFAVVLPILVITYYTYKIYMEKVEEKNAHIREMSDVYLSTVEALTMAIDAKDQMTYGHVRRVRAYAIGIGQLAGLEEAEAEGLKAAALLHDVGKLAIPEHILNKPGKLSPSEFRKMKSHTVIGAQILSNVRFPYPVIPMVRHHHEWWDGTGYPDHLAGTDIPLGARVLAIADCYDAMRSPRPYHREMTRDEALAAIVEERGTHFDPELVDLFAAHHGRLADEAEAVPLDAWRDIEAVAGEVETGAELRRTGAAPAGVAGPSSVLDEISSAHRETRLLNEMSRAVGLSLSLEETMHSLLDALGGFVPYTTAVVYLKDEAGGFAAARAVRGRNDGAIVGVQLEIGQGATGWAIRHNRPLMSFDPTLDLACVPELDASLYRCGATFPLSVSDRVLGAITLYSHADHAYDGDHGRVMEIVTHQASMSLLNAVVHEQTQATALTDPLTGIPNSRFLQHAVAKRLDRGEVPFYVVLLDLDGFKLVNDRLGHAVGDRVLKETAAVLGSALRAEDYLVRLGGDEFVVVSGADPSHGLMQRLQTELERHNFELPEGSGIRVGLSAGHAAHPDDGDTLEQLLAAADRRMYEDKARRKRVRKLLTGESKAPRVGVPVGDTVH